jgi:hypothetical protein
MESMDGGVYMIMIFGYSRVYWASNRFGIDD